MAYISTVVEGRSQTRRARVQRFKGSLSLHGKFTSGTPAGRSMSFVQTKLQRDFPALQMDSWKVLHTLLCHPCAVNNEGSTSMLSAQQWQHVSLADPAYASLSCIRLKPYVSAALAAGVPHQLQIRAPQVKGAGHASCSLLLVGLCYHSSCCNT